jgi:hypothetical protein
MDALLHWDFSPGRAVAAQVRRRFGCPVHFSPSPLAKEFFLVASFSSASFPLNEDSVGLALQCCIGGDCAGLRVFKLSDRRFRFSVFSNKVGHFIYGLKDKIWPDFIYHFRLYRGDTSGFLFHGGNSTWFSSDHNLEVAQRSPTRLNLNLSVIADSASRDPFSSAKELVKFGVSRDESSFIPCNVSTSRRSSSAINFGNFSVQWDDNLETLDFSKKVFIGSNCARILCSRLPILTLEIMEDQRQAGYTNEEIMQNLKIPFIPPKSVSFQFIGRCYKCGLRDHLRPQCPGICAGCQSLGRKCSVCVGAKVHTGPAINGNSNKPKKKIWRIKQVQQSRKKLKHLPNRYGSLKGIRQGKIFLPRQK